ncbi:MAG: hypothetical protein QXJ16_03585 [Desulfurococcaceae archaeon]
MLVLLRLKPTEAPPAPAPVDYTPIVIGAVVVVVIVGALAALLLRRKR